MIRAKHFKKLVIIENKIEKEYSDVVLIPTWLLKSILRYDDELLTQPFDSLTDCGKGVVLTIRKQQETLSINLDR